MNRAPLLLAALVGGLVAPATLAEDKLTAEIFGENEIVGLSEAGVLVGDSTASYQRRPARGKVSVVTKEGRLHRVETYTEWDAVNGVRGRVWEKLYVSGGIFTGWTEHLIQTAGEICFTRNVIDGDIQQEIDPSGSGFIEWTVTGAETAIESEDSATTEDGDDLPTVEILQEGEFDGVSDRRIEIDAHGEDAATVRFRDFGYTRVTRDDELDRPQVTVNQELKLEGRGRGSLEFVPVEESTPTPSPTPQPSPAPEEEAVDSTDLSE